MNHFDPITLTFKKGIIPPNYDLSVEMFETGYFFRIHLLQMFRGMNLPVDEWQGPGAIEVDADGVMHFTTKCGFKTIIDCLKDFRFSFDNFNGSTDFIAKTDQNGKIRLMDGVAIQPNCEYVDYVSSRAWLTIALHYRKID